VTDLEHVLGPRLNDLADYLTEPVGTVPAGAAIARYRRQRRTRAGLAAVAAAVALIAIGVPTAMTTLGAGRPAGGGTAGGGTSPVPPAPPQSAVRDAQAALEQAQLKAIVALLAADGPVRLTAPAQWGSCPNAAPALSSTLHTDVVSWYGSLPGGPDGCQFANAAGTARNAPPEDRLSVGIGFRLDASTGLAQTGAPSSESAADAGCVQVDAAPVAPGAELQRCSVPGAARYYLTVPDPAAAGVWVLGVTAGDRYPGDPAGPALAAVTQVARSAFGG